MNEELNLNDSNTKITESEDLIKLQNENTELITEDKKVSFLDTLPINKKKQSTNSMYAEQNNKSYELVSSIITNNNILENGYKSIYMVSYYHNTMDSFSNLLTSINSKVSRYYHSYKIYLDNTIKSIYDLKDEFEKSETISRNLNIYKYELLANEIIDNISKLSTKMRSIYFNLTTCEKLGIFNKKDSNYDNVFASKIYDYLDFINKSINGRIKHLNSMIDKNSKLKIES